jgi:DASS family divalent anion:Na+ symporter
MSKKQNLNLLIAFLIGLIIWFLPHSSQVPKEGWQLFAIFVATIVAIILKPLPMGAVSILAVAAATLTQSITLEEALGGFHNDIVWLIVLAFFISRAVIKTGLGARIAYHFVSLFGKRSLGLSYSMLATELLLAPAIPSVTARTGGIIYPILVGLARSFGSDPKHHTERRIGSFLMKVAYQGSAITSAMFMTGMAANSLLVGLTRDAGYTITWGQWALGAIVPGLLSLFIMPLIIYKFYPPELKETPEAPDYARKQLKEM